MIQDKRGFIRCRSFHNPGGCLLLYPQYFLERIINKIYFDFLGISTILREKVKVLIIWSSVLLRDDCSGKMIILIMFNLCPGFSGCRLTGGNVGKARSYPFPFQASRGRSRTLQKRWSMWPRSQNNCWTGLKKKLLMDHRLRFFDPLAGKCSTFRRQV